MMDEYSEFSDISNDLGEIPTDAQDCVDVDLDSISLDELYELRDELTYGGDVSRVECDECLTDVYDELGDSPTDAQNSIDADLDSMSLEELYELRDELVNDSDSSIDSSSELDEMLDDYLHSDDPPDDDQYVYVLKR